MAGMHELHACNRASSKQLLYDYADRVPGTRTRSRYLVCPATDLKIKNNLDYLIAGSIFHFVSISPTYQSIPYMDPMPITTVIYFCSDHTIALP